MSLNLLQKAVMIKKQQGSALVMTVFIIVVMALLATAITRNISASSDQNIYEVLGTRALFAAETGNELALATLFPVDGSASVCQAVSFRYFDLATQVGLQNCVVSTSCQTQVIENSDYTVIVSTGVCKNQLQGNNGSFIADDLRCLNTDAVCASRSVTLEVKG